MLYRLTPTHTRFPPSLPVHGDLLGRAGAGGGRGPPAAGALAAPDLCLPPPALAVPAGLAGGQAPRVHGPQPGLRLPE